MFEFVIHKLKFLRNIPLLPFVFDSFLKLYLFITNKQVLDLIDELEDEIMLWNGVHSHFHKYGGLQFDFQKSEIGHIHGNGLIDILIDRKTAKELIVNGKAMEHHTIKNSGWISFYIKSRQDFTNAIYLFRLSYQRVSSK